MNRCIGAVLELPTVLLTWNFFIIIVPVIMQSNSALNVFSADFFGTILSEK